MTRTRVAAALVMAPVAIAAILLLDTPWMMVAAAAVFLAGLWEWFDLAEVEDSLAKWVLLIANLGLMVAIVWASRSREGGTLVLYEVGAIVGIVWWALALLWLGRYEFGSNHESWARAIKLAAGTLAVVPAWCALTWMHADGPNGHKWLLTSLAAIWAADTGAYFCGRRFGRHKLAPRVSPNKTWEGLVGGVVVGTLVALGFSLFAHVDPRDLPKVALVAAASILVSVIGDLFESLLKRHAGKKDSGTLIPGHGGALDRIDAVLAALPVFALGKALLGL
ncbi:phosphatidate cytidylyltransferase [Cognatilysobacter lacus]|uniref:Phosphatidate cytidylyltransferase n=1 Tax=Cognatilysobacter lacus TaxID=1643323 RepID=A0A5D8Z9A8_9GAMM|nr:phosphatidate cytidylyltransferase [Lysobacter lacus]TZF91156.1 phosphatidate cytidylyltransferase [Lysobacter lacus]